MGKKNKKNNAIVKNSYSPIQKNSKVSDIEKLKNIILTRKRKGKMLSDVQISKLLTELNKLEVGINK